MEVEVSSWNVYERENVYEGVRTLVRGLVVVDDFVAAGWMSVICFILFEDSFCFCDGGINVLSQTCTRGEMLVRKV